MPKYRTLGDALYQQRVLAGLTGMDVEAVSGIANEQLSRYENNRKTPTVATVKKLLKTYKTRPQATKEILTHQKIAELELKPIDFPLIYTAIHAPFEIKRDLIALVDDFIQKNPF